MRIFGYEIHKAAGGRNEEGNKYVPRALLSWLYGREYLNPEDQKSLLDAYKSWVYVCATRNAQTFASTPLRIYATKATSAEKVVSPHRTISKNHHKALVARNMHNVHVKNAEEIVEILDHRLSDLIHDVNPWMNYNDLFTITDIQQELTGNAYWYLVRDGTFGLPVQIWPLPPDRVRIVPSKERFIEYYAYNTSGAEYLGRMPEGASGNDWVRFEPDEIIHFKFPNPRDPYYGSSPLQAVASAYNINENMNTYEAAQFANNARMEGYFNAKESMGDDEFERMKEELMGMYTGVMNQGKVGVTAGDVSFEKIGWSPRELGFLKGRTWTKEEIYEAYGNTLGMTSESASRANADAAQYVYAKYAIEPRLIRFEEKLNEQLSVRYDSRIFVSFDSSVPEDREFQLKEDTELVKADIFTRNEVRGRRGFEEVEWGDAPMPTLSATLAPEGPPMKRVQRKFVKASEISSEEKAIDREVHWNAFVKRIDIHELTMQKELVKYFEEQEKATIAALRKGKAVKAPDDTLFNPDEWAKKLAEVSAPILHNTLVTNANSEIDQWGFAISFDVDNPRVLNFQEVQLSTFSKDVTDTTKTALRATVSEGTAAGETIDEITDRVKDVFTEAKTSRAKMIARTETVGAANFGSQESYEQAGVEEKEWLATLDDRVRDSHAALDGDVVGLNETFNNGLAYPGDPTGDAGEIINCRCTLVPVVPEPEYV